MIVDSFENLFVTRALEVRIQPPLPSRLSYRSERRESMGNEETNTSPWQSYSSPPPREGFHAECFTRCFSFSKCLSGYPTRTSPDSSNLSEPAWKGTRKTVDKHRNSSIQCHFALNLRWSYRLTHCWFCWWYYLMMNRAVRIKITSHHSSRLSQPGPWERVRNKETESSSWQALMITR